MEVVKGLIGNALTSTAADHVVAVAKDIYDEKQERYQDDINNHLLEQIQDINDSTSCFSSGLWENLLHWSNIPLWNNNKFAVTEDLQQQINQQQKTHVADINKLSKHLEDSDAAFSEAVVDNDKKHKAIDESLSAHNQQIKALEVLIQEHDKQITDLLNGLCCFGDGQWDNELKWSNDALWENSNLMCDTFVEIYNLIEQHQKAIQTLNEKIESVKKEAGESLRLINETFDGFREEHQAFKKEHETFKQEHEGFRNEHQAIKDSIASVSKRQDTTEKTDSEQQRQIDMLLYRISLVTNGLWDNALLWGNDSEWSNIANVGETCDCPEDTQEKIEALQAGLAETNKNIDDNHTLIVECQSAIATNSANISDNAQKIEDNSQNLYALKEESKTEHRETNYQLRAIGREQTAQDENIAKIGGHFSCFADGVWGDLFIWDNILLWANETGVIDAAIAGINTEIELLHQEVENTNNGIAENQALIESNKKQIENNVIAIEANKKAISDNRADIEKDIETIRQEALAEHREVAYQLRAIGREQTAQDEDIARLGGHFGCFVDGEWGNLFLWDNSHTWANNPGIMAEVQVAVAEHDERLTALETMIAQLTIQLNTQQSIIAQQQEQLGAMMDCFTVTNIGVWQNPLLWNNVTKWSDTLITEQIEKTGSVSVKSYDEQTETISI